MPILLTQLSLFQDATSFVSVVYFTIKPIANFYKLLIPKSNDGCLCYL